MNAPALIVSLGLLSTTLFLPAHEQDHRTRQAAASPEASLPLEPPAPAPRVLAGDIDADGVDELLVLRDDGRLVLLRNLGDRLEDATAAAGLSIAAALRQVSWARFGGGAGLDVLAVTTEGSCRAFVNSGAGLFEDATLELGLAALRRVRSFAALDLDSDGLLDLVVELDDEFEFLRGRESGAFERLAAPPEALAAARDAFVASSGRPAVAGSLPPDPTAGDDDRPDRSALRGADPLDPHALASSSASAPASNRAPLPRDACAASLEDQAGGGCLTASSVPTLGSLFPLGPALFVAADGKVGVGTTSPTYEFDVAGIASATSMRVGPISDSFRLNHSDTSQWGANTLEVLYGPINGEDSKVVFFTNGPRKMDMILHDGRLGVKTDSPVYDLDVAGIASATSMRVGPTDDNFRIHHNDASQWGPNALEVLYGPINGEDSRVVFFTNGPNKMDVIVHDGRLGIGTDTPQAHLDVNGSARVDVLTITGGSDLVEGFEANASCAPGTVVVVDAEGKMRPATRAYDTAVAGVVSGAGGVNAGLRLGQEGVLDGETDVAVTGRAYVWCTAEREPIVPGDLLTSSEVEGHAMRVEDREHAFGAVLGKALSSLPEGKGLVLVLVNLQ